MKIILGSRIYRYVKRLGIFLIIVALVMGLASCESTCAPIQYDLTFSSTEGGEVIIPGEGTYADGTVVTLEAVADECYEFVNWTGANVADPNSATTTITMDEAKSVTANFALLSYDLTVDSTDGGEVTTPDEGTFTYDCGTVVDLVAAADLGYHFIEWTGDISTVADVDAAETTITMSGDYSITANFGPFAGGNGTTEDPYQIADWYNLDNVRNYLSSHFIVINDLDSNSIGYTELASASAHEGKGWQPIGTIAVNNTFVGSFDGQGYEICDLFIDRPDESEVGLFGVVEELGVIENVGVVNGNVSGNNSAGGLVGKNEGTVSNSYSTGNVTGNLNVGGLVGYNFNVGTVTDSYATGSVTGEDNVGGLVGWNRKTMSNSYATGSVTGQNNVGGLVGKNSDTASNSYATGSVTGYDNVGGLVGKNDKTGTVSNSYSTGNVTGELHVGGLVGDNAKIVSNSYSTGYVTGNLHVGGLVGNGNPAEVSNSFWDTETSGQATSDGGTDKTTAEMMNIATFTGVAWNITAVDPGETDPACTWNIVDTVTYPFLSWESVI